jgi:hypothetical protein
MTRSIQPWSASGREVAHGDSALATGDLGCADLFPERVSVADFGSQDDIADPGSKVAIQNAFTRRAFWRCGSQNPFGNFGA